MISRLFVKFLKVCEAVFNSIKGTDLLYLALKSTAILEVTKHVIAN